MKRVIRYFQSPAFTEADWSARNPLLLQGEVGYVIDNTGKVINAKVGPGLWNDLSYIFTTVYPYTDTVTNPIGDATGDLSGLSVNEILYKMLNPYVAPSMSDLKNNASGTFQNASVIEIGQVLSGFVQLTFGIQNDANLNPGTPVNVSAGSTFSNEGSFAKNSPITLTIGSPISPTVLTTIQINITLSHLEGTTGIVSTYIYFRPRIIWTSSPATVKESLTGFSSWSSRITNNYKQDYNFNNVGYPWIAIPTMLAPSSLIFSEVSDPNAPANFEFISAGSMMINNGVGEYNYTLYRGQYYLNESSILRIS